jgi:hemolysin III
LRRHAASVGVTKSRALPAGANFLGNGAFLAYLHPWEQGIVPMRRAFSTLASRARADHADLFRDTLLEEIANSITHGVGVGLAITALVLGVVYAAEVESAFAIVGAAIYGATLIFAFLTSTLYHSIPHLGAKRVFLALDHCAIFLLIAGTYTAITLAAMHGTWQGWVMFGVVWGLAITGMLLRLVWLRYMHPVFYLIYLAMGWLGFAFGAPLEEEIGWGGVELILIGGVCYTGGLVFYALRRLPFNHALWHLSVLAGSIVHFFAIYDHVIPSAG